MLLAETLRHALFWVAVLAFVLAQFALLARSFAARPSTAREGARPRSGRALELAMQLTPAVLLAVLLAFAWRAVSATSP